MQSKQGILGEFAAHVVIGGAMFILLAGVSLVLHLAVHAILPDFDGTSEVFIKVA